RREASAVSGHPASNQASARWERSSRRAAGTSAGAGGSASSYPVRVNDSYQPVTPLSAATRARRVAVVQAGPSAGSAQVSSAARNAPSGSLPLAAYCALVPPMSGSQLRFRSAVPLASTPNAPNVVEAFAARTSP